MAIHDTEITDIVRKRMDEMDYTSGKLAHATKYAPQYVCNVLSQGKNSRAHHLDIFIIPK